MRTIILHDYRTAVNHDIVIIFKKLTLQIWSLKGVLELVRLADLHEAGRASALTLDCPVFPDNPFVSPKPLQNRIVALVSSAGLIVRGSKPFRGGDASYRRFKSSVQNNDLLIGHISINFDRTAAIANIETILPRQTLAELATANEIGACADTHYSFMGATDPTLMRDHASTLAQELKTDKVDTAVLLPV